MSRSRVAGVLAAVAMTAVTGAAQANPPAPGAYQQDDYLGFRNALPPGQNGFVTQTGVFQFLIDGTRPPHNSDQLAAYGDLVYDAPGITESDVNEHFKDASFGVPGGQVESSYTPECAVVSAPSAASPHCDDVLIVRDSSYGVPHIYGADRAGLMFGIGYATAEDRLFAMDVQRHAGRAELSSFLGGSNVGTDRSIWRSAPYTDEDLEAQFDAIDDTYGADGAQVQQDVTNFVAGINQYIAEARTGPTVLDPSSKIPGEYNLIGKPTGPDAWNVTDVISTASLVAGIFGKGGGGEVRSAQVLEAAEARFPGQGQDVWSDFRSAEDGEAPTTVHDGTSFPYGQPPANPEGVALPDPGTVVDEPIVADPDTALRMPRSRSVLGGLLGFDGASNALLVSGAETESGTPLAVMGPQVGYYSPGILYEQDIHAPAGPEGPAVDARGVAFSGANLYVQLGRGTNYAWSATSSNADNVDQWVLQLCEPLGGTPTINSMGYVHDSTCVPIETYQHTENTTPAISWRVERTPDYGPITERGTLQDILDNPASMKRVIIREIEADAKQFGDARRTVIEEAQKAVAEQKVIDEPVTVIISEKGWVRARTGIGHEVAQFTFKAGDALYGAFECRTVDTLLGFGDNGKVYSVPVAALPGARGDGVPITTLVDLSGGVRILHYFAGSAHSTLLLASSAGYGFAAKAGDMVSRLKGGKAFMTLDEGAVPLPPRVIGPNASALACLSEKGRLLVFGMDELKTLSNGGRGVILMELEDKEKLLAVQPISQKGVTVLGTWAGAKPREVDLSASALALHIGKRARKGKVLAAKIKVQALRAI